MSHSAVFRVTLAASALIAAAAFTPASAQVSNLLTGQNVGAVGGAVLGGVAGNKLAGKKNKTLGTVGGAALGGVAGAVAGNMYDKSGKTKRDVTSTGSVGSKSNSLINGRNVGIVGGAVAGGVVGNKLGGKKHKTLGTVGGVIGGGLAGGAVGSMFDRR